MPSSLNTAVDPALDMMILTALDKSPTHRFATAGTLADALDEYLRGEHESLVSRYGESLRRAAQLTRPEFAPVVQAVPSTNKPAIWRARG